MILTLENQVCSLESAKRLKELGAAQESLFYWKIMKYHHTTNDSIYLSYGNEQVADSFEIICSAYTVAELGEFLKLKGAISSWMYATVDTWKWTCFQPATNISFNADTEAEARAKMLIHLISNGLSEEK